MSITVSEREFMDQVTQMAELFRWAWVHFRPAQTQHGWRTPVSGPLGKGWPDLFLVRDDRMIFAELKVDLTAAEARLGKTLAGVTMEQERTLRLLGATGHAETYVWRPVDFETIARILT